MIQKTTAFKSSLAFKNQTMVYFYRQVAQQQQILRHIQAVLPEALAQQIQHCLIKDNKLFIYTQSASWASQLRFYHNIILASVAPLTAEPINIMQVKLLTRPTGANVAARTHQATIPSMTTIEGIYNDSQIISDAPLQQALLKLTATLKRRAGLT